MDRPVLFHRVEPEVRRDAYTSFDNVDFVLTGFEGRALDLNSVRVEGVVNTLINNLPYVNESDELVYLDRFAGCHSFFETIQVQVGGQVISNQMDYPRYVKMKSTAQLNQSQMYNSENVCEGKQADEEATRIFLFGEQPRTQLNNDATGVKKGLTAPDFSIKPRIPLNQGFGSLPYARSGDIIVTLTIARKEQIYYGPGVNANVSFNLSDLRMTFTSSPDPGNLPPVQMATTVSMKQSILSNFANISMKVPAICRGVSCSFQDADKQNTLVDNNLSLVKLPKLDSIEFLFNDSTSKLITYKLDSNVDILNRYIESFGDTGVNSVSKRNVLDNQAYGVGVDFGTLADLRNQKFSVQIDGDINNVSRVIYLYFHSFLQV